MRRHPDDEKPSELIGMADIAQLAGQSRATVGNWKKRYADFPAQRGETPRGPLYDAAEVAAWLASRGAVVELAAEPTRVAFDIADLLRGTGSSLRDQVPLVLAILAAGAELRRHALERHDALLAALREILGLTVDEVAILHRAGAVGAPVDQLRPLIGQLGVRPSLEELADLVSSMQYGFGELQTSLDVAQLMARLVGPGDSYYDPCAGVGLLLAACARMHGPASITAQEVNEEAAFCARMVSRVLGWPLELAVDDTLRSDRFQDRLFQCVVADPPIGQAQGTRDLDPHDARWLFSEPRPYDLTGAWIQHCLHHLAPGGRAVVLVNPNTLTAGGPTERLRQGLARADVVDAVIALPQGTLPSTSIAPALLVLRRDRPRKGSGTPGPILVAEVPAPPKAGRHGMDMSAGAVLVDAYLDWSDGLAGPVEPARPVAYQELVEADFNLQPRRLLPLAPAVRLADWTTLTSRLNHALERTNTTQLQVDAWSPLVGTPAPFLALGQIHSLAVFRGPSPSAVAVIGDLPVQSPHTLFNGLPPIGFLDRDKATRFPLAQPDDLLVAISHPGKRYVYRVPTGGAPFVPSNHWALVRCVGDELRSGFLDAWFRTPSFRREMDRLARGQTIQRVAFTDFMKIKIPIPPLATQEAAADRLNSLSGAEQTYRAAADAIGDVRARVLEDLAVQMGGWSSR